MTAFVILTLAIGASGCAGRRAPEPVGDIQTPRVGWVVMHGHRDNPNEEFACQSNPRTDCAVRASRAGDQAFSQVHLYFFPTKTETTYSGSVHVRFFSGGEASSGVPTQVTVKPDEVGNYSVVGIVTDKPGQYTFTVDMSAVIRGGGDQHIREQIPVAVILPGSATQGATRIGPSLEAVRAHSDR